MCWHPHIEGYNNKLYILITIAAHILSERWKTVAQPNLRIEANEEVTVF